MGAMYDHLKRHSKLELQWVELTYCVSSKCIVVLITSNYNHYLQWFITTDQEWSSKTEEDYICSSVEHVCNMYNILGLIPSAHTYTHIEIQEWNVPSGWISKVCAQLCTLGWSGETQLSGLDPMAWHQGFGKNSTWMDLMGVIKEYKKLCTTKDWHIPQNLHHGRVSEQPSRPSIHPGGNDRHDGQVNGMTMVVLGTWFSYWYLWMSNGLAIETNTEHLMWCYSLRKLKLPNAKPN